MTANEKERRVLTVLYRLSKGIVGARVSNRDLLEEINRSSVMQMSAEQFEEYRTRTVNQYRVREN